MNQKTKYFFLIKYLFIFVILISVISILIKIGNIYNYLNINIFDAIETVLRTINILSIISLCSIIFYFIYQLGTYFTSSLYKAYEVNVFEAIYHGFMDIHLVYEEIHSLTGITDIKVYFKEGVIIFSKKGKHYSIMFLDLFGNVDGREDSEFWFVNRRLRKKFGREQYTKRIKFPNPILVNSGYVEDLYAETDKIYHNYVAISGFYKLQCKSKKIISPFEIRSIVEDITAKD